MPLPTYHLLMQMHNQYILHAITVKNPSIFLPRILKDILFRTGIYFLEYR